MQKTWVWKIPWRYPLQYSGLENSMDCTIFAKSGTWQSDFHFQGFKFLPFHFYLYAPGKIINFKCLQCVPPPRCGWRAGTSFFLRILPLVVFCFYASDTIKQLFLISCLTFLLPISDFSALFFQSWYMITFIFWFWKMTLFVCQFLWYQTACSP